MMRFPLLDPGPRPASTLEGIALQGALLDQVAPLFLYAMTHGQLGDDPYPTAIALMLFDRDEPRAQVLVLATMDGEVLYIQPTTAARAAGLVWPWTTFPRYWEEFMAAHRWYQAWQMTIGGQPCEAAETGAPDADRS